MATRSTIAKINADGTVKSVYCHWDGYPEGVGAMLKKHYTDPAKIEALLDFGDISVLDTDFGEQNDFDNRTKGVTLFYRDRGEDSPAEFHNTQEEWLNFRKGNWCEYGYLWADNTWWTFTIKGA